MTVHRRVFYAVVLFGLLTGPAGAEGGREAPKQPSAQVTLGVQPLGIPSGVISSVMQRDKLLKAFMTTRGGIAFKPHAKGAEIVTSMAEHQLQGGLLGDMPTLLATSNGQAVIVGLVKQTATAIVGRSITQVSDLKGKRIGYIPMSSAHHTLLQGLRSAGLGEDQVKLVQLPVNEMAEALARNDIDAFAAWEPSPSVALAASKANRVVFRGRTSDFFVLDRGYADREPESAHQIVAAFIRAIEWMRRSPANLGTAVRWAQSDAQAFSGKVNAISEEQIARITRQDILEVPAAPVIPARLKRPPLSEEFEFLRGLGKLPPNSRWEAVLGALGYDGLTVVLEQPQRYRLNTFDYAE